MSERVETLVSAARQAADVRAYETDPDVVALRVERVRAWSGRLAWTGIVTGLAFTMVNVQRFAADAQGAEPGELAWFAAWLLDPMVSLILISVLLAEQVTSRYQVPIGAWPRAAKWAALTATYGMNTWSAWAAADAALIVLHSVPPLMVFVAVEATPAVRDRLTEAMFAAERQARARAESAAATPQPQPAEAGALLEEPAATATGMGEVAQPARSTATGGDRDRNQGAPRTATTTGRGAQPRARAATGSATGESGGERAGRPATEMRRHWDAERAEGRIPSGAELARVGGVSAQYARKLRAGWLREDTQAQPQPAGDTATDVAEAQPRSDERATTATETGQAAPHPAQSSDRNQPAGGQPQPVPGWERFAAAQPAAAAATANGRPHRAEER